MNIQAFYLDLLKRIGIDDISDLIQDAGEDNFTFIVEHFTEHGLIAGDAGERYIGGDLLSDLEFAHLT